MDFHPYRDLHRDIYSVCRNPYCDDRYFSHINRMVWEMGKALKRWVDESKVESGKGLVQLVSFLQAGMLAQNQIEA